MSAPKIPRLEESQSPNYSNEEVTMQIRQQLFSLLHAQNCHQQECPYSACWKVKSLVNHMIMCAEGKSCQTSLCTSSKHILKHWHECTQRDYCPVCSHLRKDNSEAEAQKPNAPTSVLKEVDSSLALRAAAVRQDNSRAIISTNVITIPHPKQPMTDESLNSLYDCQFWEFHQEAKDYAAVELHRFWHHCFEVNHTITRRIYSQSTIEERIAIRNSCNEFCMIQILSKKGLLDLILGPESDGITIYRVNQQLAFTLIGYLSYCQRAETVQQMCTHPACNIMKINFSHMEICEKGKSCEKPFCPATRRLIYHWRQCKSALCPVCPLASPDEQISYISIDDFLKKKYQHF